MTPGSVLPATTGSKGGRGRGKVITPTPMPPRTKHVAGSALPCFCPWGQLTYASSTRVSSTVLPRGARSVLLSAVASKGQDQLMTPGPGLLIDAGGEGQGRASPQHPCHLTQMNGRTSSPLLYPQSWFTYTPATRTSCAALLRCRAQRDRASSPEKYIQ